MWRRERTVDEIHDEAEVGGCLEREMKLHDEGVIHDLPGEGALISRLTLLLFFITLEPRVE